MRRNRSQRRQTHCHREKTVSTVSAGIVRIVCERCGHVSVAHHHDLVSVDNGENDLANWQPIAR